ncbi:MAG: tRNA (adenosine(37)-N6)-threonylcarbamoyltransferase complex ATPase subunit type 1 TsaE [Sedimentisphaerales bacterium]|nr:tRNA (adenosine(37)-N6)-threonylcarbamoyltransferase complex ATPase subunit type 1 TsaE [Sedimentisphaerales bacterium]
MDFSFTSHSPQQTIKFGNHLGSQLKGGEIIAFVGPLGSGKTHLIKGIVEGLGAHDAPNEVTSPTFVLVNEYTGRLDIFHIDAYRLESLDQFEQIGFDDYCRPDSVVLIEWADKVKKALAGVNYFKITLTHLDAAPDSPQLVDFRTITITNYPDYILL